MCRREATHAVINRTLLGLKVVAYLAASASTDGPSLAGRVEHTMNCNVRELLSRMMTINNAMGDITLTMLQHSESGELRSADLRVVGRQLALLGADMVRYANESDRSVDAPQVPSG